MPKIADRVQETTTTTGTGTITLAGATTGYRTFATAFSNGDSVFYTIDDDQGNWEVGYGTFTSSGTTLSRNVIESSNSNTLVNFAAGSKRVFCSAPYRVLLPDQASANALWLTSNGTIPSWATITASTVSALPTAGGTMSGNISMGANVISNAKYVVLSSEYDNGNSGTTFTYQMSNGQNQKLTLTGNCTLTVGVSGLTSVSGHFQLKIIQDATGSRTLAFTGAAYSASNWLGSAAAPAILTAANSITIVNFYWDGTNVYQAMSHVGAA